jgi:hypothetical protein
VFIAFSNQYYKARSTHAAYDWSTAMNHNLIRLSIGLLIVALVGCGILYLEFPKSPGGVRFTLQQKLTAKSSLFAFTPTPVLGPPLAEAAPKITWTPSQLQLGLSQGQSRTVTLTFSSNQALYNVTVEAVPAIAPFVSVSPQTIPMVPANTPGSISLAFATAPTATIGTYEGTIHVRNGSQTYIQTLKISLEIVNPLGKDISTLMQRNQLVILGTVTSVQSAFDQSGKSIFTTVNLLISRVLKGALPAGTSSVNIQFRGGTVSKTSSVIAGSPSFTTGESVVVFLGSADSSGTYSIPDQALGTFHILPDPVAGEIAIIDQAFSQIETLEGRTPDFQLLIVKSSQHQLSLNEFLIALGINR